MSLLQTPHIPRFFKSNSSHRSRSTSTTLLGIAYLIYYYCKLHSKFSKSICGILLKFKMRTYISYSQRKVALRGNPNNLAFNKI